MKNKTGNKFDYVKFAFYISHIFRVTYQIPRMAGVTYAYLFFPYVENFPGRTSFIIPTLLYTISRDQSI